MRSHRFEHVNTWFRFKMENAEAATYHVELLFYKTSKLERIGLQVCV